MHRTESHCGFFLEQLEPRVLLSAESGVAGSGILLPAGQQLVQQARTIVNMDWQGYSKPVAAGEWVVRFNDVAGASPSVAAGAKGVDLSGATLDSLGDGRFALLRASGFSAEDVKLWASGISDVAYVEPNFVRYAGDFNATTIPNDTSFGSLWGLHNIGLNGGTDDADIDAPEAWDLATGSNTVVVAVLDTGIDYTHPDLVGNMWINPLEVPGNGLDDDGNGYYDDVYGYDFAYEDGDPMDVDGHGTHVAGTIGATGQNNDGVVGVNWDVQMMALKFLNDDGSGYDSDAIAAIDYMTMMKRDYGVNIVVSNNSWGGGEYGGALNDAINDAAAQDILFVAAAGNGGVDGIGDNNDLDSHYPSNYESDHIISVAATDRNDQLAEYSNFGQLTVDLAAPGSAILSTLPGGEYGTLSGTSMAAPHVTGVVALMASLDPTATGLEIKGALLSSVDPISAMQGVSVTGGRLNAHNALLALAEPGPRVISVTPLPVDLPTDTIVVTFTENIDPASIDGRFLLCSDGVDDIFDTDDDFDAYSFTPTLVTLQPNQVQITLGADLPAENYRLTIVGTGDYPVLNMAGEALNGEADYVYEFEIVEVTGANEPNDRLLDATDTGLTGVGTADFIDHEIGDGYYGARDVDIYKLDLAIDSTLVVDIDASQIGSNLDPILRVFNSGGVQIAVNDDTDGYDSYIRVTNLSAGVYYVGVSGYSNFGYNPYIVRSGANGSVGFYDLYFTVTPAGASGSSIILTGSDMTLGINGDGSLITSDKTLAASLLGNEFLAWTDAPLASFSLSAGGNTYQNNAPFNVSAGVDITLTDISTDSMRGVLAVGSVVGLDVDRVVSFGVDDRHALIEITLTNVIGEDINNVAWLESLQPNQGFNDAWNLYSTRNDVDDDGRYVEAVYSYDAFPDGLTMALGSADGRAVASTEGNDVADPFDVIGTPEDDEGVATYNAINLAFNIGTLGAYESTSFAYYLLLDTSQAGAAQSFDDLIGGDQAQEPPQNDMIENATQTGVTGTSPNESDSFSGYIGNGAYGGHDVDIYEFQASAGDVIVADIETSQTGNSLDSVLRLFDSSGTEIAMNDDSDGLDSYISYVASTGGIYYIGVSGYGNLDYDPEAEASGYLGSFGRYTLDLDVQANVGASGVISGYVTNDIDENGQYDLTDEALSGWLVYADLNLNGTYEPSATGTVELADANVDILDNDTVTSTLTVGGFTGAITDIDVELDITHTYDSDLNVFLISPMGLRVALFSAVGDWGENFTGTILDDQALLPIASGSAPFMGRFQPAGNLSDFNGQNPNGEWTLEVTDTYLGDSGTINSWSVTVTVGEPSALTKGNGEYSLSPLAAGTYVVRQELQSGWLVSYPGAAYHEVTLSAGQHMVDQNFGNMRLGGDADLDGDVDLADFNTLKNNFESGPGKTWAQGDFTGDGEVKLDDFNVLKNNFTGGGPVATQAGERTAAVEQADATPVADAPVVLADALADARVATPAIAMVEEVAVVDAPVASETGPAVGSSITGPVMTPVAEPAAGPIISPVVEPVAGCPAGTLTYQWQRRKVLADTGASFVADDIEVDLLQLPLAGLLNA